MTAKMFSGNKYSDNFMSEITQSLDRDSTISSSTQNNYRYNNIIIYTFIKLHLANFVAGILGRSTK